MYIKLEFLQTLHYYFFFMGILSFFVAFLSPLTSVFLIFFYVIHSVYAWLLTWYAYKKIREMVVIKSMTYIAIHIALTVAASGFMFFLYSFFFLDTLAFTVAIIQLNFYVFFVATCWLFIVKFNLIKRIFKVHEDIKVEYGEPVAEGTEMKIITKAVRTARKPGGVKTKVKVPRAGGQGLKKSYQIEIYQSQIRRLKNELKKTKDRRKAGFCLKRIEEYERKIRNLKEIK